MASFGKRKAKAETAETGALPPTEAGGALDLTPDERKAFKKGWKAMDLEKRRKTVLRILHRFYIAASGEEPPEDADEVETPDEKDYADGLFHHWPGVTMAQVLSESVWNLGYYIEEAKEVSWADPMVELHYAVPWDFEEEAPLDEDEYGGVPPFVEPSPEDLETFESAFEWVYENWTAYSRYLALSYATNRVAVRVTKTDSYAMLPPEVADELEALPEDEREARQDALFRPRVFASAGGDWWRDFARSVGLPDDVEELREAERPAPLSLVITRKDEESGESEETRLSLFCAIFPLVLDRDAKEAYFPVQVGFQVEGEDPGSWEDEEREGLWKTLADALSGVVEGLIEDEEPAQDELPGFEAHGGVTMPGPTFSGYATVTPPPVEAPTATLAKEGRSLKVPRRYSQGLIALSPEEALGPRYLYENYPDLDPARGGASLKEAERLFFQSWETYLETVQETFSALTARPYLLHEVDGNAVYVFPGLEKEPTELLWETFEKTLSTKAGGPGLQVVRRPVMDRIANSEPVGAGFVVRVETRLSLWQAENVLEATESAVRFEGRKAPGYLDLLSRHEGPYRDGPYLVLEKRGSEVYAVQPGGSLLRDVLERYKKDERVVTAALQKLRRQQPSLFVEERGEQETRLREMEELLEKLRERVEEVSSYDCLDLYLEVWKAWDEQKDAWAQGLVRFPDGLEVKVGPLGAVVLRPEVLQQYAKASGDHWRPAILRKLRALSTFEYVVRDENGEEKEGANFVSSVVDGRREETSSAGLALHLSAVGRWPCDYFFVGVNAAYVIQVQPYAFDEDGKVHWREDAIRLLADNKRKQGLALKEAQRERDAELRRLRKETYYQSLPDFTRWREAQGWGVLRKGLSEAVLVETTPQRRTPASLQGAGLVACNGGANKGYKLSTWKKKAHYSGHHWRRKLLEDFQALADSPLGLAIETERYSLGTPAQTVLGGLAAAPREDPTLRLYRRADANERAREELQKGRPEKLAPLKRWHRAEQIPLHEQVRRARIDAGIDQKELARLLEVNQSTVSRWEKGQRAIPADMVGRIRELLGDRLPEPIQEGEQGD